jgi:hypothetical protein
MGMQLQESERERHMRQLAAMLLFEVQRQGNRFTLSRSIDVSKPIRHENLSLDEVEALLNTWKLRGLHGG